MQVDKSAFVTVTIHSNPRPRTTWFIEGVEVQEGAYQDRFEARTPVELVSFKSTHEMFLLNAT